MVVGSNPVAVTSTSDIASVSSKEFLHIHATTECRFTLKCVCDMIKTHKFPCHPCYVLEYIYPHIFHVNFFIKRHATHGHRISCTSYQMEWTDNKPFSGLIDPRRLTTSRAVAHQSCVARCYPHVLYLAKAFKLYYIFGFHFPDAIKTITMIHYCYCSIVSGK